VVQETENWKGKN